MLRRIVTILIATLGLCLAVSAQESGVQTSDPKAERASIAKPPPVAAKRKQSASSGASRSRETKKKTKSSSLDTKKSARKRPAKSGSVSKKNDKPVKKTGSDSKKEKADEQKTAEKAKTEVAAPAENVPAAKDKPPMGENDSIPFMQTKSANVTVPKSAAGSIWLKTIGSVLLILGLLFIGTWVFKKTGLAKFTGTGAGDSPELKILSSVSPKNGQTISVVRFGERVLLVGSTAQSFTLLADDDFDTSLLEDDEANVPFEYQGKPVSVSELLAREETTFAQELKKADSKLPLGLGGLA